MGKNVRVTLCLPKDLWEKVKQHIPAGRRSHWVTAVLDAELKHQQRLEQLEEFKRFQSNMREKYGVLPSCGLEIEVMRQERDDEISSIR